MKPRNVIIALALATITALPPASAAAAIEPQVGIARIEIGMTPAEVIRQKGEPDANKIVRIEIIGDVRKMRYGKTKVFFFGPGEADTVYQVDTRSRGQRTEGGAGIGSSVERVEESVPDVRCRREARRDFCFVGRRRPGKVVTAFLFSRKTDEVSRVLVGVVID